MMHRFCVLVAIAFCPFSSLNAAVDNEQVAKVRQLLIDGLREVHRDDRTLEELLVSSGLSLQDAERQVDHVLVGLIDCAFLAIQAMENIDLDVLMTNFASDLSEGRLDSVFRQLQLFVGNGADTCMLDVMQEAGFSVDMLPPLSSVTEASE